MIAPVLDLPRTDPDEERSFHEEVERAYQNDRCLAIGALSRFVPDSVADEIVSTFGLPGSYSESALDSWARQSLIRYQEEGG